MTTGVGRMGFVKIYGKHMPQGYWGRYSGFGVHSRLGADQTIFKMLKAHIDKVMGAGLAVDLWREIPPIAFAESTPISGISIISYSLLTPAGNGTFDLTISGVERNVTWTPNGGSTSDTVDIAAGGNFVLRSDNNFIMISVNAELLPSTGGPYTNTITFSKSLVRTPNFNAQVDQTSLVNDIFPICSCYKQTSKQPDNKCRSCYGTGIIPGYTKFGYIEHSIASIDPSLTLVDAELHTDFTPFRLQIAPTKLSCIIESPAILIESPGVAAGINSIQYKAETYLRQPAGTSVLIEVRKNSDPYAVINTVGTLSFDAGDTVQLRITMTRTSASDKSPFFEILRIRYSKMDEPFIRVLKGRPTRTRGREQYGVVDSDGNVRWWTVPLRHFDANISQDPDVITPPEENIIQQKAFVEFREGVHTGLRFDLVNFEYSDPKGIFISQAFSSRHMQRDEIQYQVF